MIHIYIVVLSINFNSICIKNTSVHTYINADIHTHLTNVCVGTRKRERARERERERRNSGDLLKLFKEKKRTPSCSVPTSLTRYTVKKDKQALPLAKET